MKADASQEQASARNVDYADHKGSTMISIPVLLRISVFVGIHAGMLLGLFAFF
jgi:hypothetical protein